MHGGCLPSRRAAVRRCSAWAEKYVYGKNGKSHLAVGLRVRKMSFMTRTRLLGRQEGGGERSSMNERSEEKRGEARRSEEEVGLSVGHRDMRRGGYMPCRV